MVQCSSVGQCKLWLKHGGCIASNKKSMNAADTSVYVCNITSGQELVESSVEKF